MSGLTPEEQASVDASVAHGCAQYALARIERFSRIEAAARAAHLAGPSLDVAKAEAWKSAMHDLAVAAEHLLRDIRAVLPADPPAAPSAEIIPITRAAARVGAALDRARTP